jgi:hypothetical protein
VKSVSRGRRGQKRDIERQEEWKKERERRGEGKKKKEKEKRAFSLYLYSMIWFVC